MNLAKPEQSVQQILSRSSPNKVGKQLEDSPFSSFLEFFTNG